VDKEELEFQLREVDLTRPTVSLRVRLLDRKPVEVTLNEDFNVQEVRAWLEHHHAASFTKAYHLMDVNGFPPKNLAAAWFDQGWFLP